MTGPSKPSRTTADHCTSSFFGGARGAPTPKAADEKPLRRLSPITDRFAHRHFPARRRFLLPPPLTHRRLTLFLSPAQLASLLPAICCRCPPPGIIRLRFGCVVSAFPVSIASIHARPARRALSCVPAAAREQDPQWGFQELEQPPAKNTATPVSRNQHNETALTNHSSTNKPLAILLFHRRYLYIFLRVPLRSGLLPISATKSLQPRPTTGPSPHERAQLIAIQSEQDQSLTSFHHCSFDLRRKRIRRISFPPSYFVTTLSTPTHHLFHNASVRYTRRRHCAVQEEQAVHGRPQAAQINRA